MTVIIGSRWAPGHSIIRDAATGAYVEVNSPMHTETEIKVQQALLRPRDEPSEVVEWWESSEYNEANYGDEYQRNEIAEHSSPKILGNC